MATEPVTTASGNNQLLAPVGAYSQLDDLIRARFAASHLSLQANRRVLSAMAGPNRTRFRGRGIDFEEVRNYQPGDDIRTIDWRVTARSGKAHTKLFREERERPTLVVVDQRAAMFFGSQTCFKSVLAAHLAALIAWAGLANGDRVGGLVFGIKGHQEIRPRRSRNAVLHLLNQIDAANHQLTPASITDSDASSFSEVCMELLRIARPGTAVFIISDFADFDEQSNKYLFSLSQHCDLNCLFTFDPLEQQLPDKGWYSITNGQQRFRLNAADRNIRSAHQHYFAKRQADLTTRLGKMGAVLLPVSTVAAPLGQLQRYYGSAFRNATSRG